MPKCKCDNCNHVCETNELNTIKHYNERMDKDEPEPAGECPKCGCLSYEED